MTGSTKVWASNSTMKSQITAPMRIMPSDPDKFDMEQDELDHWAAVSADYKDASIREADALPKVLTGFKLDTKLTKLPDFFIGGGFFIVSRKCADVFQKFDLGYGGVSPVTIYQGDRKSFMSGPQYYILYFGCQKQAFIPDLSNLSPFYIKSRVRGGYFRYTGTDLGDGDCALSKDALEGRDLWIDPTVGGSFFMSNRLVDALKAAGLSKNMFLKKCRVIE